MTVETAIFDLLSPAVAGNVYPDVAPANAPTPYITYQQVGGQAVGFLENTVPSKKHGRYQINVWAPDRIACAALALQVEALFIAATTFQSSAMGAPVARFEPDTNLYGSMQDFSIWSDR